MQAEAAYFVKGKSGKCVKTTDRYVLNMHKTAHLYRNIAKAHLVGHLESLIM